MRPALSFRSLVHALHVIHHMVIMSSHVRAIMNGTALMGGNNIISEEELRAAPESGAIKGKPPNSPRNRLN